MRLINAVREWNAEGRPPLRTIALYTAVDRHAMFVREADEAVLIGPDDPTAASARPAPTWTYAELERALRACPRRRRVAGLGLRLREGRVRAAVPRARDRLRRPLPRGHARPRRQDRVEAAGRAGRRAAGARGAAARSADVAAARAHAEGIGYPLMVKATAGGGGRGIRLRRPGPTSWTRRSSGPPPRARGPRATPPSSSSGRCAAGGTSRCRSSPTPRATCGRWACATAAVQRRNQKVIEESASTALDAEQEELLRTSAAELVRAAGYVNAGTVEFLYEPERAAAVVPRGQHAAAGGAPGHRGDHRRRHRQAAAARRDGRAAGRHRRRPRPAARGHAIEARLTAEDPEQGFAPAPGRDRAPRAARRPGRPRRHRGRRGRRDPAPVRLDDRQGDRLGPRPRRGPRPGWPGRCARPRR